MLEVSEQPQNSVFLLFVCVWEWCSKEHLTNHYLYISFFSILQLALLVKLTQDKTRETVFILDIVI